MQHSYNFFTDILFFILSSNTNEALQEAAALYIIYLSIVASFLLHRIVQAQVYAYKTQSHRDSAFVNQPAAPSPLRTILRHPNTVICVLINEVDALYYTSGTSGR